jgi:hypothetical protein
MFSKDLNMKKLCFIFVLLPLSVLAEGWGVGVDLGFIYPRYVDSFGSGGYLSNKLPQLGISVSKSIMPNLEVDFGVQQTIKNKKHKFKIYNGAPDFFIRGYSDYDPAVAGNYVGGYSKTEFLSSRIGCSYYIPIMDRTSIITSVFYKRIRCKVYAERNITERNQSEDVEENVKFRRTKYIPGVSLGLRYYVNGVFFKALATFERTSKISVNSVSPITRANLLIRMKNTFGYALAVGYSF